MAIALDSPDYYVSLGQDIGVGFASMDARHPRSEDARHESMEVDAMQ